MNVYSKNRTKCLDCYIRTILSPTAVVRAQTKGETNYSSKGPAKGDEGEKIVCARAMQTRSALEFVGGFLGPGTAAESVVSKSGHELVRDAHWAGGPGATYIRCSNREEGGRWRERERGRKKEEDARAYG